MRSVLTCIAFLLATTPLSADGQWRRDAPSGSSPSPLESLRYTVRSQQDELRMAQEQIDSQAERLELLREDFSRMLGQREDQAARDLQHYTKKLQESDSRIASLKEAEASLRNDLTGIVDHVKELHTLVESLQNNLQKQVKKNELLEKTLSTLINSLGSTATSEESGAVSQHRVSSGETLEKIARKYGVSLRALKEHNELQNDRIRVGQTLKLPSPATPSSP